MEFSGYTSISSSTRYEYEMHDGYTRSLYQVWYNIYLVYPKTITRYYGTLYCTGLRPVHKITTMNYTNYSVLVKKHAPTAPATVLVG